MLVQWIFQIIIICAAVIVACTAYLAAVFTKSGFSGMPSYLYAYIDKELPLNSLLMVVLQMVFALVGYRVSFKHISNHVIISLEILYFESLLLMLFCKAIKGYRDPLAESLV